MAARNITSRTVTEAIRTAQKEGRRVEIADAKAAGLVLRANPSGSATWTLRIVRHEGGRRRFRKFTLGDFPTLGLAEARERARKLRAEALDGHDPIDERREAHTAVTVGEAIDAYVANHLQPNLRSAAERERQIREALRPHLDLPIGALEKQHLQRAIHAKAATAKVMANRFRAALKHFAGWLQTNGYVETHIGQGIGKAARETPRERVLDLSEIRAIWAATMHEDALWGPFTRLLIITAQRRGDIAGMRWPEINLETRCWTIAGNRTKNGKSHITHLSEPALTELASLAKHRNTGADLLFTTTGHTPVSGFGKMKARLDRSSRVSGWRLHDLRTAFASMMCEAGEAETVVDRVLNHVASGSAPSAVSRIYNRSALLTQRAAVLDKWAEAVTGERGTVVQMPKRG